MLAFLRRNINDCPENVKATCYKTLVRPILEYGSAVWDPHHQVDIDNLEQIQKRAARFTTGNYTRETGNTKINMQKLKWKPLEERRAIIKLNLFYKCKMQLIDIHTNHLVLSKSCTRRGDRTYAIPTSNVDSHLFSFFPNSIRLWNAVPSAVKDSRSIDSFKSSLDEIILRSIY